MAISHSIDIESVRVKKDWDGSTNVVCDLMYIATATSGSIIKKSRNPLFFESFDSGSLIDISSITKDTIIGWIENDPNDYYNSIVKPLLETRINMETENEYINAYPFDFTIGEINYYG